MTTAITTPSEWRDRVHALVLPRARDILGDDAAAQRMARAVLLESARPPAYPGAPTLRDCDPLSVLRVTMDAAALRLYPGPLQHCHLVPRRGKGGVEAQLLLGYRGLIELARRSGEIVSLSAHVVYRDEVDRGLWEATHEPAVITHRVALEDIDRRDDALVAAYARAVLRDGGTAQRILTRAEIDARRSKAGGGGKSQYSPWSTDYPAMARKSALRALLTSGLVPMAEDVVQVIREDAEREVVSVQADAPRSQLAMLVEQDDHTEDGPWADGGDDE